MEPVTWIAELPPGVTMPPDGTQRACCDTFVPYGHTGLCPNSVMMSGGERFWAVDPPPGTASVREEVRPQRGQRSFIVRYRMYYAGLVIGLIAGVLLGVGLR
jgi:hypothetical protein